MGKRFASLLQINLVILAFTAAWVGYTYINQVSQEVRGIIWVLIVMVVTVASIIASDVVHSIFHEIGHLLGGRLSGYSFLYFGCFKKVWIKENGKLVRKNANTKSAGGTSRLSPPEMKGDTFPFRLYFLSGALMNLLFAALFFFLFFLSASTVPMFARIFLIFGLKGIIEFLMNFVPIKADYVWNDGYTLFNLGREKNKDMNLTLWRSLQLQALLVEGHRPRDIPEMFYSWANINKKIEDPFVFEAGFLKYKSLLDKGEFGDARACLQTLSNNLENTMKQNQGILNLEVLFLELIDKCRENKIQQLDTAEVKEYIKSSPLNESMQRTLYAYARLFMKDTAKAKAHLDLFHKACANSVNLGTIPTERDLVELVDKIAEKRK